MGESERVEPRPKKPGPAERRREIEARISTGAAPLTDPARLELDDELDAVLDTLFTRFRRSWLETSRLGAALEIARVLDLKLTLLRNYTVDPTSDARSLAQALRAILGVAGEEKLGVPVAEAAYLDAVLSIYAGDPLSGLTALERLVDGHDDDQLVALRYHAHMIAAHLRHELSEFERAREDAAKAADLATSGNPAANALAVAGVNSFALGERDRALRELEDALRYFDANEPLFNPYFHRNTLLLCGLICFERGDDGAAESFCRRAVEHAEPVSYEAFEAWSRLGRVLYRQKRIEEAADAFEKGIVAYRYAESAPLLDVCFWLARACVDLGRIERARTLLLRIVTSEAEYASEDEARQMLAQLSPTPPKVPTS